MTTTARYTDRPWVAPEAHSAASWGGESPDDLRALIERAARNARKRSRGKVIHALVAIRAALLSRLSGDEAAEASSAAGQSRLDHGPWKRRLRRRYAASLCTVDRLLDQGWESGDSDSFFEAVGGELVRLHRLEALENRASFEQHWTDLGIGDWSDWRGQARAPEPLRFRLLVAPGARTQQAQGFLTGRTACRFFWKLGGAPTDRRTVARANGKAPSS